MLLILVETLNTLGFIKWVKVVEVSCEASSHIKKLNFRPVLGLTSAIAPQQISA